MVFLSSEEEEEEEAEGAHVLRLRGSSLGSSYSRSSSVDARERDVIAYITSSIPSSISHTGAAPFDEHLRGVMLILRGWNATPEVQLAGALHSVYGTEGFQGHKVPWSERPTIRRIAGDFAEKLAFVFCLADRESVDFLVNREVENMELARSDESPRTIKARLELGHFDISLKKREWVDFVTLTLADWLEQVEGAASKANVHFGWQKGEAWSYRRTAYANMAKLLHEAYGLPIAVEDHKLVYGREPPESRHLEMKVTPAMTESAREARMARDMYSN